MVGVGVGPGSPAVLLVVGRGRRVPGWPHCRQWTRGTWSRLGLVDFVRVGVVLTGDDMCAATFGRSCRLCASGRISSSPSMCSRCSHLEKWTLLLCPRIFQPSCRCLGVACGEQRFGYFGRSCVLATWFDSGYMFFERLWTHFSHFLRCGELES